MELYHKHSDLLDNIKDRLKDGEYKMLIENLSEIKNIKKQVYVKVNRISFETIICTETIPYPDNTSDSEDECDNDIHTTSSHGYYTYEACSKNCRSECDECRLSLNKVQVRTMVRENIVWMKVDESGIYEINYEYIGRYHFDKLKSNKTIKTEKENILVYLEDNE